MGAPALPVSLMAGSNREVSVREVSTRNGFYSAGSRGSKGFYSEWVLIDVSIKKSFKSKRFRVLIEKFWIPMKSLSKNNNQSHILRIQKHRKALKESEESI